MSQSSKTSTSKKPSSNRPMFANFMQIEQIIPQWFWQILRLVVLAGFALTIFSLIYFPDKMLMVFWGLVVPILPLIFWIAPGLWRNMCPLAMANQIPRKLNFTLAKEVPAKLKRYAGVVGLSILFIAVPLRKIILNDDAIALAIALVTIISLAFIGGIIFKGRSGWCSNFCPILPVERLYGQSPSIEINNSHCKPCVGCTKNCFDFNPQVAYLADLYDSDPILRGDRRFVAGLMPGLLLAYFGESYTPQIPFYQLYLQFGLYCLIGIGAYHALETLLKLSPAKNTAIFAMVSVNIFYWYASLILQNTTTSLTGINIPDFGVWIFRSCVLLFSVYWLWKTFAKENLFLSQAFADKPQTKVASIHHLKKHGAKQSGNAIIEVQPSGQQLVAKPEMTLLDLLESNGHKINAGCRMGACGADPVAILEGEDSLDEKSKEESQTLERLGYKTGVRMACCVKAISNITINLDPSSVEQPTEEFDFEEDENIHSVVIVGNGIAGVTAADFIRRHHKNCKIHLIGQEKYPLYNRMAISKLIYNKTALQNLILMPDEWYSSRDIQQWLNTQVRSIDSIKKLVELGTGESINYDRLIITTGSNARIPKIKSWNIGGCFSLRTAEDGMSIRTYLQQHHCKKVVIAGGGLLGLEVAYAFTQVGVKVTVLERSNQLLTRQLDGSAANILHSYLAALGIIIIYSAEIQSVIGEYDDDNSSLNRISAVKLKTGETLSVDLALVAAGITANKKLSEKNNLDHDQGLIVDDHLRTSIKHIYAAGDIAQLETSQGKLPGLWPIAVEQGRIAAINALGGDQAYQVKPIATGLKVVGVELTSMGKFIADENDQEYVVRNKDKYQKVVIHDKTIVGCILLGHPEYNSKIIGFINSQQDLSEVQLDRLEAKDWSIFN